MIRKGHWGVKEEAVQKETREAMMVIVRFMVVWLEI